MCNIYTLTALLILALSSTTALAQKQYTTWYFGYGLGLDFNSNPPILLTNGQTQLDEGSAVYCDPETGELLLYTAGGTVWDRLHREMPNGQELISGFSSTQAALIVPDPIDQDRFYIFHTDHINVSGLASSLYYSVCDMKLNNGFGDITLKNVELLSYSTEKLTAVQLCNDQSFWIIGHEKNNNAFLAWRLDENGLSNQPVRSQVGDIHGPIYLNWIGYLTASPNGAMLASAIGSKSVELFRFNTSTGKVYDPIRLPKDAGNGYGVSFSPDNTKIYVGGNDGVTQYDITNWDSTSIAATGHRISSDLSTNAIKLGPDQKLYLQNGSHIGVIHKPNLRGNACEYDPKAIHERNQLILGLPNNIDALGYKCKPRARIGPHTTSVCEGNCTSFIDSSRHTPTKFSWSFEGAAPSTSTDENPTNICYRKEGTYTVKLVVSNEFGSDSTTSAVHVRKCVVPEIIVRDTTICISECLIFKDTSSVSTKTEWQFTEGTPASYTGKTPPPICYYRAGKHLVRAIASNEYGADTATAYITVENCDVPIASFIHDTLICVGGTLALTDKSLNKVNSWDWTFEGGTPGSSTEKSPNIVFSQIGLYEIRLIASNIIGSDTAFSKVRVTECHPPVATLHDYEICQGDCIYLEDSSTNTPTSWEWQLEGITPGLLTSSKPGHICYETPGRFSIQLISRNAYGADTVRSNVWVRPATGYVKASLDFNEALEACSFIDTSFWVYAGCKDNLFNQLRSDDPNILLPSTAVTIRVSDSLKVAMRIMAGIPGTFTSTISFSLNGEVIGIPCNYTVKPGKEKFVLSTMETEFVATHCDPLTRELTITNKACTQQEISRIYLDVPSSVTPFTINYDAGSLALLPEHSLGVTITYDPKMEGDIAPDLVIETASGEKHVRSLQGIRSPLPEMSMEFRSVKHSTIAGDKVGAALAFETAIGDTALPSVIIATLNYNTDLLSVDRIASQNGWSLLNQNEGNGKLELTLSRQQNMPIRSGELLAELTFRTFLTKEDSTQIALSSIICDPDNAQFAACILAAGHTGSGSVHVGALCGDELLREKLGKQKQLSVIVQPNPMSGNEKLSLFVSTVAIGEILLLDLVDLSGKRVELQSTLVKAAQEHLEIALPNLPSGSYILRATLAGEQVSQQLVIY